jgi:hypothetical protein
MEDHAKVLILLRMLTATMCDNGRQQLVCACWHFEWSLSSLLAFDRWRHLLLPPIGSDFTVVTLDHSFVDGYSNLNNSVLVPLSDK